MDLFKLSILKLVATGVRESSEVADLLSLHKEFVDYLLNYELGAYVKRGKLTDKGIKFILADQDSYDTDNLQELYFFADAFSGRLFPRVEKRIPAISSDWVKEEANGSLSIDYGSKGQGSKGKVRPFYQKFPRERIPLPSEKEFCSVLERYSNLCENRDTDDTLFTLADKEDRIDTRMISSIKSIEFNSSVYLLSSLIESDSTDRSWSLYDPFELGFDNKFEPLVSAVEKYVSGIGKSGRFSKVLSDFINSLSEKSKNKSSSESSKFAREKAELYLNGELGDVTHITVYEQLCSAYIEYEQYCEILNTQDKVKNYVKENASSNFLKNAVKTLEILFETIWVEEVDKESYQSIKHLEKIPKNQEKEQMKIIVQKLKDNLGFERTQYMYGISPTRIGNVCKNRHSGGSLKAQVLSALLTADRIVEHPLRQGLKNDTGIIDFCFIISNERNSGNHKSMKESGKKVILSIDEMKDRLDQLIRLVKIISEKDKIYKESLQNG